MPVHVVKIERLYSTEIVYNFSVEEDESYILNGVVSHNCRCDLAPLSENVNEESPPSGERFDEWLRS
jgi:hypothetical protein